MMPGLRCSDLLRGSTADGKQLGDPRVYHEMDRRIVGGLAGLASVAS